MLVTLFNISILFRAFNPALVSISYGLLFKGLPRSHCEMFSEY